MRTLDEAAIEMRREKLSEVVHVLSQQGASPEADPRRVTGQQVGRIDRDQIFFLGIDRHVRDLASSKRLPGVEEIRIPGQGRAARRAEREANGVPLADALLQQVDEMAKALAITPLTART